MNKNELIVGGLAVIAIVFLMSKHRTVTVPGGYTGMVQGGGTAAPGIVSGISGIATGIGSIIGELNSSNSMSYTDNAELDNVVS